MARRNSKRKPAAGWSHALTSSAAIVGAYAAVRGALALSRRYSFRDRLVVITGGSRGLGLLMARQLACEGAYLVLCARDPEELAVVEQELKDRAPFVATYVCDLADPDEIAKFFEKIRREIGSVDVLINNAGIMEVGPVETMSIEDYQKAMAVHFWAPLLCIEHVLPDMRRRGNGRIVNISSIGGEIGVPHMAPYCASKFALNGLSQALRAELANYGVYVTTVCPGLMRTGSPRNALFKGKHRAEYAWFSITGSLPGVSMNADRAARQIVNACRYGRAKITLSIPAKLAITANTIAPELTANLNTLVAWLMPRAEGRAAYEGFKSKSAFSPSILTALNERAAEKNNEMLQEAEQAT
jgi:short-subunit dehydrogenase